MLRNYDFLWLTVFTLYLVVAMEREKKGKEEGKGKKKEKEEKIFLFDRFERRKEKKEENVCFYFVPLLIMRKFIY